MTRAREAGLLTGYFLIYLAYLFVRPEGELMHWLTLVTLPVTAVWWMTGQPAWPSLLASIGLSLARWRQGLGWALGLGAVFQILQFLNTRQRAELIAALDAPSGVILPFAAFGLLVVTVATTEEVFFRGLLQSRLSMALRSELAGLALTILAFIAYHVPYAYLKPSWPSAGDLPAAIQLAAANGGIGGTALGLVFWRGRRNLIACIVLHALIDLVPAMRLVHRTWFST